MWVEKDNKLYRKFKFSNFSEAFTFMSSVAVLAEKANHHPTWTNTFNVVEIWLTTHDAGNNITAKDHELAAAIDEVK